MSSETLYLTLKQAARVSALPISLCRSGALSCFRSGEGANAPFYLCAATLADELRSLESKGARRRDFV